MRPGGTPIGENFELKTPSNVIFHTEQEYEIHFFYLKRQNWANYTTSIRTLSPAIYYQFDGQ